MKPFFFFNGTDTAPSETQRSDDGASVVAVATCRRDLGPGDELPRQESDWDFDYCYGRVFTAKHRLSARQWSGWLHGLHRRFGFTRICLDGGAGGGGVFVKRELLNPSQLIDGVESKVVPIFDSTIESQRLSTGQAQFILNMFKRGDPGCDAVWPDPTGSKALSGDDLLKDGLLSAYRQALGHGALHWPPPADEYLATHKEETAGWGEERVWALKNLTAGTHQLTNIVVETMEKDGQQVQIHTSRGARKFSTLGHDDIAYAMMYCYAAFRIWLQTLDEVVLPEEDSAGFAG